MGKAQTKAPEDESYVDELAAGTELLHGQYKIERFLNSGGFGITYLAADSLDRKVVIKECFPSSFCHRSRAIVQARSRAHTKELQSVVKLFVQEARSLAKLDHPNIVGVHQVFEDNDTAYMVLDFVEGRDLLDTLEDPNHGLTAPQIKGILKDVLGAVAFIHDQGILHRDISPDNILIDEDLRPVLIDFGAAREEATKKSRVLSAMRVVKDGYSPQEFYVQGSAQGPFSDLYALGATFYHLIAGEIPPNSQARLAAIASGEADPYESLTEQVKGYDRKFLAAIDKAMAILPKDRVQSAQEWLDFMEGNRRKTRVVTQKAPVSSAAAATAKDKQGSKMPLLLGSVAAIAIAAVGGYFAMQQQDAGDEIAAIEPPAIEAPQTEEAASAPVSEEPVAVAETETPLVEEAPADAVETEVAVATEAEVAEPSVSEDVAAADTAPTAVEAPEAVTELDVTVPQSETTLGGETSVAEAPAAAEADEKPHVIELSSQKPKLDSKAPASVSAPEQGSLDALTVAEAQDTKPAIGAAVSQLGSTQADVGLTLDADALEVPPAPEPKVAEVAPAVEETAPAVAEVAPTVEETPSEVAQAAPAIVIDDASGVLTGWSAVLPFSSDTGGRIISEVADVAPLWAKPGVEIFSVNAQSIDSFDDIEAVLRNAGDPGDVERVRIEFIANTGEGGVPALESWSAEIFQKTALINGFSFETRHDGEAWVTRVTDVPAGSNTELQVGDILIGNMTTSELLKKRTSLPDMIRSEFENGATQLSFAVSRNGSMWVAALNYAGGL